MKLLGESMAVVFNCDVIAANREEELMSIQEVSPEHLAQLFHNYHRVLPPDVRCHAPLTSERWEGLPQEEKRRLIAAAQLALIELSRENSGEDSPHYFAKPGEAEWGC